MNQAIIDAARELDMTPESFAKRLRTMTLEEARKIPKKTKSQAGIMGKNASPWRKHKICKGSKVFE